MVTKLVTDDMSYEQRSVLAKILMVTKPKSQFNYDDLRSVLAKILMVTKPQKYGSTFLNVIEY